MRLGESWWAGVPMLGPGLSLLSVYLLWFVLQELGLVMGSQDSLLTIGLTGAGWALAWGLLLAGAAAGGWGVRLVVLPALVLSLLPSSGILLMDGFSGWVLIVALALFLVWRWRQDWDGPAPDLLVPGVIILLIYSVLADRSLLMRQYEVKEMAGFIAAVMDTETLVISLYAGGILFALGGLLGDLGAVAVNRASEWLLRMPAPLLAAVGVTACLVKIAWAVSRYTGPAWLTGAAMAAAIAGWLWLTHPRPDDPPPARYPVILLAAGFVLVSLSFGYAFLFRDLQPITLHQAVMLTGAALLLAGGGCLVLGRRAAACLAGLAGIWFLLFEGALILERLDPAVSDGLVHGALLGWAAWHWRRGRRDSAPYALLCGAVLWLLVLDGLGWLLEQNPGGLIFLGLFLLLLLYGLGLLVARAVTTARRQGVALVGLGLGGLLLLFATASWGQLTDLGHIFSPATLPVLGYALLAPPVLLYGLLHPICQVSAEGRGARV